LETQYEQLQALQLMKASKKDYEMNKTVLEEQEAFEAERLKLNEVKRREDSGVIAVRNDRLDAIGKERALGE
jgi:hypothetical protein